MATCVPEILRGLRCDRAADERRRHPRVGLRARVTLESLDRHQRRTDARQVWLRDLSEGGAGLLVPDELRAEQPVVLHVPVAPGRTAPVRCRVVHCAKAGSFWRVGVEFVGRPWHEHKPTVAFAGGSPATAPGDCAG